MAAAGIRVWGWAIRLAHWLVVLGVALDLWWLEEGDAPHRWVGYGVAAMAVWRVLWGLVGPGHARFDDFMTSPAQAWRYMRALLHGHPPRYLGHSPAGGWMVLALLANLLGLGVSGWMMGLDAWAGHEGLEGLHEALALGLQGLVVLHVAGVLLASWRHRENLVASMVSGRKPKL